MFDPSAGVPGVPSGMVNHVIAILESVPGPIRRRKILETLEGQGHRISLAGLNRVLQHCKERGWTQETPEGVRLSRDHPQAR